MSPPPCEQRIQVHVTGHDFARGLDLADLERAVDRATRGSSPLHRAITERLREALSAFTTNDNEGAPP